MGRKMRSQVYLCTTAERLHPMDKMFFEEDITEMVDIIFERGLYAGRVLREFDFLVGFPQ